MLNIGLLSILMMLFAPVAAGCAQGDAAPPDQSNAPAEYGRLADNTLPPEEIPGAVLDTLPRHPLAEEPSSDSEAGFATSPMVSACHGEQCPEVHTTSQQWAIEATGEEIEAWYWDQLVSQGYRNATRGYGMRGGRSHSSIVFFHPALPDVNVQLHLYPQGNGVTVLDLLVVYLEPLHKPDGPVIPSDADRVEIHYLPNDARHAIREPSAVQRLVSLANSLPVRPDYIQFCPIRPESGATLTFVSTEGESWEVRIVHPGCPYRVEFEPYPHLYDTRQLLWEAVQQVIGEKESHEAKSWPGRPAMPTMPPQPTPPLYPSTAPPSPTPTPPATNQGSAKPAGFPQVVDANNRFALDLLEELRRR